MVDTSKVTNRIQARSQAESPQLRRHRGVVQSIATNGTVGVTLDGGSTVIAEVRRFSNVPLRVGDTVEIVGDDTDLMVVGTIAKTDVSYTPGLVVVAYNHGTLTTLSAAELKTFGQNIVIPSSWNTYLVELMTTAKITNNDSARYNITTHHSLGGTRLVYGTQGRAHTFEASSHQIISWTTAVGGWSLTGTQQFLAEIDFPANTTSWNHDNVTVVCKLYRQT